MSDEINKLVHFKQAVLSEIEEKAENIIDEAQKKAEKRKSEVEKAVLNNETAQLLKIDKQIYAKVRREISSKELDSNRAILLHRKNIVDKVFENVENNLKAFRNGESYKDYLINSLKKCVEKFPDQKGVIAVGKADEKYVDTLKRISGFDVEIKLSIQLGGFLVSYPEINVMLDCTFDSALEEEKENFCNVSLLTL